MRGGSNLPAVGSYNRSVLLAAIRDAGLASRVDLVAATGLTAPTVGRIVRGLIDDGLVTEVGPGDSRGGKPRTMLRLESGARTAVGVHVDPEATTYVVTDLSGKVLARSRRVHRGRRRSAGRDHEVEADVQPDVELLGDDIEALIAQREPDWGEVLGVGVATPGPIDFRAGVVLTPPNLPGWHRLPLRDRLADRLGLPVLLDNDATVAALGEQWVGSASSVRNFAVIYLGTGIGSGIMIDGQPYRGSSSNAGEIGHVSLDVEGPECFCGNRGCLELYSAPRVIVAEALERLTEHPDSPLRLRGLSVSADHARICAAARAGDPYAASLVQRSARYLALGAVTLVNVLDLELVVLAGPGFDGVGPLYVEAMRTELDRRALVRSRHPVEVRLSPIAQDVVAVGAASLVMHSRLVQAQPVIAQP
jgi:predicted NBD/HSP70 family sugar kinase